jgi:hypothetical protein
MQKILPDYLSPLAVTETYDGPTPCLVRLSEDHLIVICRESDRNHVDESGRVVVRESHDGGVTWAPPRKIHDVPNGNTAEPSVVYRKKSDKLVLFDAVIDSTGEKMSERTFRTYKLISTDRGETWSTPEEITSVLSLEEPHPFGGGVKTSRGWMSCFYEHRGSQLEALFQESVAENWNRSSIIAETPPTSARQLTEPCPVALTSRKILVIGRDNVQGDFYVIQSSDGGGTWGAPIYFNPNNSSVPTAIWAEPIGEEDIALVWGDRDRGGLCAQLVEQSQLWERPGILNETPVHYLYQSKCESSKLSYWDGNAGDFGYPSVEYIKTSNRLLITFYDGTSKPNVWIAIYDLTNFDRYQ